VSTDVNAQDAIRSVVEPTFVAIYARKSTEQKGVLDDAKSVEIQIRSARASAEKHGWTVLEEYVYADDGISGAEFEKRPEFMRMIADVGKRSPFRILIIADISRLGREQLELGFYAKRLDEAGVKLFSYLDDQFIHLSDPTAVMGFQLAGFAATMQRTTTSKMVRNAMIDMAKQGYATGATPYGYELRRLDGLAGKRGRVIMRIDATEGPVVVRIFERAAAGAGFRRIAFELTRDEIKPRRAKHWAPNSIRGILENPVYKGEREYGRTSNKTAWGKKGVVYHPREKWLTGLPGVEAIVTPELWEAAARARATTFARQVAHNGGRKGGRLRDGQSKYLLCGLAQCALCGGPITAIHRPPCVGQTERYVAYGCGNYHRGGRTFCRNATTVAIEHVHRAIVEKLLAEPINDEAKRIVEDVLDLDARRRSRSDVPRQRARVERLTKEVGRFMRAVKQAGDDVPELVEALRRSRLQLTEAQTLLAVLERPVTRSPKLSRHALLERVRGGLRSLYADLEGFTATSVEVLRDRFRMLLAGPIKFEPAAGFVPIRKRNRNAAGPRKDCRAFRFEGAILYGPLLAGVATMGGSGTGSAQCWKRVFQGIAA